MRGYDGIAILLCYSDRNGVPLLQEGDGIVIRNAERLASDVLPRYYKHSNYQSFVRQLNIYGFHKTKYDERCCEFKHPHFRRGERHLLGLIRRKGQGNTVVVEETRGIVARVSADLRVVCNRVAHLEAEMGMINQRHDVLKRESQALWRVMLEEGGQRLTEKAIYALRQMSTTSSELLSLMSLHPPYQWDGHQQQQQRQQRQRPLEEVQLPQPRQSPLPQPQPQPQQQQQQQQQQQPTVRPRPFPDHYHGGAGDGGGLGKAGVAGAAGAAATAATAAGGGGRGGAGAGTTGAAFANSVAAALTGSASDNGHAPPAPPPSSSVSSSSRAPFPTPALDASAVDGSEVNVERASPPTGAGGKPAASAAFPWAWWTEGSDGDASGSGLASAADLSEGVAPAHGVASALGVGSEVAGGTLTVGPGAGAGAGAGDGVGVDTLDRSGSSSTGGSGNSSNGGGGSSGSGDSCTSSTRGFRTTAGVLSGPGTAAGAGTASLLTPPFVRGRDNARAMTDSPVDCAAVASTSGGISQQRQVGEEGYGGGNSPAKTGGDDGRDGPLEIPASAADGRLLEQGRPTVLAAATTTSAAIPTSGGGQAASSMTAMTAPPPLAEAGRDRGEGGYQRGAGGVQGNPPPQASLVAGGTVGAGWRGGGGGAGRVRERGRGGKRPLEEGQEEQETGRRGGAEGGGGGTRRSRRR
eukprot:jgi/Undpi1/6174/HiC_scaffold_20.g08658.m1